MAEPLLQNKYIYILMHEFFAHTSIVLVNVSCAPFLFRKTAKSERWLTLFSNHVTFACPFLHHVPCMSFFPASPWLSIPWNTLPCLPNPFPLAEGDQQPRNALELFGAVGVPYIVIVHPEGAIVHFSLFLVWKWYHHCCLIPYIQLHVIHISI